MANNIILIGFMGSGKSTIGHMLSKDMGIEVYDCDTYLEEKNDITIEEIFQSEGEEKFRQLEIEAINDLSKKDKILISTGGGVVTRDENMRILKECGTVVYLDASVDHLYKILKEDTKRPLIKNSNNVYETISNLLSQRIDLYKKYADIIVEVTNRSPKEITEEIKFLLKKSRF